MGVGNKSTDIDLVKYVILIVRDSVKIGKLLK